VYSLQLKKKLCAELGVDTVKPYSDTIKSMYAQVSKELAATAPADDDAESAASVSDASSAEETVKSSKKRKATATGSIATAPAATDPPSADDTAIAAFKALGRASGCGPTLYKGLKEMSSQKQLKVLQQRLREHGAKWTGDYPSKAEIDATKRRKDAERELDGIDTSLIVSSKRRRTAAQVSDEAMQAAAAASDSESESGDDNNDYESEASANSDSSGAEGKPKKSSSSKSSSKSSSTKSSSALNKSKSSSSSGSSSSSKSKIKELNKHRAAVAPSMGVVTLKKIVKKQQQHHADSEGEAEFEG
jgi:hypothetical protein